MVKQLPDKWIRKAVSDVTDGFFVGSDFIKCYDTRVTGDQKNSYILMTTQSNNVLKDTKCGYKWESSILIEAVTRYPISGNTGSRLKADEIIDEVRSRTDNLTLNVASGLEIITQIQSFPNDLQTETDNEIIYRKFIRIEFLIE